MANSIGPIGAVAGSGAQLTSSIEFPRNSHEIEKWVPLFMLFYLHEK